MTSVVGRTSEAAILEAATGRMDHEIIVPPENGDLVAHRWDVAIDTLEGYRRRGHGARCVAYMIEHLRPLRPVWRAENSNQASLGLAARLGFTPVDELPIFRAR